MYVCSNPSLDQPLRDSCSCKLDFARYCHEYRRGQHEVERPLTRKQNEDTVSVGCHPDVVLRYEQLENTMMQYSEQRRNDLVRSHACLERMPSKPREEPAAGGAALSRNVPQEDEAQNLSNKQMFRLNIFQKRHTPEILFREGRPSMYRFPLTVQVRTYRGTYRYMHNCRCTCIIQLNRRNSSSVYMYREGFDIIRPYIRL